MLLAEDVDDGGFKTKLSKGQQEKAAAARRKQADPDKMIDDSIERKTAAKRPADAATTDAAEKGEGSCSRREGDLSLQQQGGSLSKSISSIGKTAA